MSTIAYDRPVTNLIAGLNATGHITHADYTKTSVTFHHNGGKFTHQGVLNVWKTRPASAHFDVDAAGAVAQYAVVHDYAWATGNTAGNRSSISIEMCNATLAPHWNVSETTWKSAARLAGWLFAHVIGTAPSSANIRFHSDWLATECPGPYMRSVRSELVKEVQAAYKAFKAGGTPPAKTAPAGPVQWVAGPKVVDAWQHYEGTVRDGRISAQTSNNKACMPPAHWTTVDWVTPGHAGSGSPCIRHAQQRVGVTADGIAGPVTWKALQSEWLGFTGSAVDGIAGDDTIKALAHKVGAA